MNKIHLTSLQVATLCFFLLNSFIITIGYNYLTNISNTDVIIDIILGSIIIITFFIAICYIKNNNKDKCLITIIKSHKYLKWLILPVFIIILLITVIHTLSIITSFINYYILKEVSSLIIMITFIATILYLVTKEISTITKVSEILFYFYILLVLISWIGLYKEIDFNNLKPLFTANIESHIKTTTTYFISSITPLLLILMIPDNSIKSNKKERKLPLIFIIISSILLLSEFILILSVLGIHLTNIYQNPDMIIYKKISLLNVLDRLEVLLAFNNILNAFFILTMCYYTLLKIMNNITKTKKEHINLALLGIITLFLTTSINTTKQLYLITNLVSLIIFVIIMITTIINKYTTDKHNQL